MQDAEVSKSCFANVQNLAVEEIVRQLLAGEEEIERMRGPRDHRQVGHGVEEQCKHDRETNTGEGLKIIFKGCVISVTKLAKIQSINSDHYFIDIRFHRFSQ